MIESFKHRGLKRLYERDDRGGIRPDLVETVERILTVLDAATTRKLLTFRAIACTSSKAIGRDFGRSRSARTGGSYSALKAATRLRLS